MSSVSVLERNIELLLARAYAPATPSAVFRARLAHTLELEIVSRASTRVSSFSPSVRGATARWAVRAAAALVFATAGILGWKLVVHAPVESRVAQLERIAANGRVAVCEGDDDVRAVTDGEMSNGLDYAGTTLTAWTAPATDLAVWLGPQGRLLARSATRVELAGDPGAALDLAIERGAIDLERYAAGAAWRVRTHAGTIELERGAITIAMLTDSSHSSSAPKDAAPRNAAGDGAELASLRAHLRTGSAVLVAGDERTALPLDADVEIRGGRILRGADPIAAAERTSARTSLGSEPEARVPDVAPKPSGTLHGIVACGADRALPDKLTITLLRDERLPRVAQPEAHVIERAPSEPAESADARREFTLTGLRAGTYSVFASAKGFATWQRRGVVIAADGAAGEIAIDLERGQHVEGRVIDAETGHAIEGAIVISQRDAPAQVIPLDITEIPAGWIAAAVTGPDGSFAIDALSHGRHLLRATHAGYGAAWSESIDVRAVSEPSGEPRDVVLALRHGGTVFGRVAHADGRPWSGAYIIASRLDYMFDSHVMSYGAATSDAEGAYSINDLPAGAYVVLNALEPSVEKVASPRVKQINVAADARIEVDLGPGRKGTLLAGRITGGAASIDLAAIDVIVEPHEARPSARKWQSERARADGTFRFADLPAGEYDVYVSEEMAKSFALEDVLTVPDVPQLSYELHLGAGEIRGRVVDADEHALPEAVVVLEIENDGASRFAGRFLCDAQGRYAAHCLPRGTYRVTAFATTGRFAPESRSGVRVEPSTEPARADTARAAGARAESARVDSASNGSAQVDIVLRSGAALDITVLGPDSRPLQGAFLTFTDENGEAMHFSPEDVTDARGKYSIGGIKAGRWRIAASHAGFTTRTVIADLEIGSANAIEIALTAEEHR